MERTKEITAMPTLEERIAASEARRGGADFGARVGGAEQKQRGSRLLRENLKALEMQAGPAWFERMKDAATIGLRRPVGALASALGGEVGEYLGGEPASFGERFGAGEQAYDEFMRQQTEKAGIPGTIAGAVGGLAAGGPVRGALPSLAGGIGSSAALGGIEGAARGERTLGGTLGGAAGGAALGGTVAGAVGGAGRIGSMIGANRAERAAIEELPEQLRTRSQDLYRQLREGGVTYSPEQMRGLERESLAELRGLGYDPLAAGHAEAGDVMGRIGRLTEAGQGGAMPLENLQNLRTDIAAVARSPDPQTRRLVGPVLNQLDEFVSRETPSQGTLGPQEIGTIWPEARNLWRRRGNLEDILYQADKAALRAASTYSGANTENVVRQNIRGMYERATKPGTRSPFSPDELEAMRLTIEGTPGENVLRSVGRMAGPTGALAIPNIGGMGAGAYALAGLDPLTSGVGALGVYGAGRAARRAGSEMAQRNVNNLMRLVGTGSAAPLTQPGPTREALAAMLAGRAATAPLREGY
jgi:hypothetical protein